MRTLKKLSITLIVLVMLSGTVLAASADIRNTNNELRRAQQLNYSKYVKNSIKNNKTNQQWRVGRKKEGFKGDLFLSFR